jgi:hypothetical protein
MRIIFEALVGVLVFRGILYQDSLRGDFEVTAKVFYKGPGSVYDQGYLVEIALVNEKNTPAYRFLPWFQFTPCRYFQRIILTGFQDRLSSTFLGFHCDFVLQLKTSLAQRIAIFLVQVTSIELATNTVELAGRIHKGQIVRIVALQSVVNNLSSRRTSIGARKGIWVRENLVQEILDFLHPFGMSNRGGNFT